MKRIIVIPARYASTRLPGKPLINVGGKPLLQWVYEGAQRSKLAQSILIATDNEKVRNTALAFGAETSEILRLLASVVSLSSSVCRHPGIVLVTVFGYIIGRVANGSLSATQPVKG